MIQIMFLVVLSSEMLRQLSYGLTMPNFFLQKHHVYGLTNNITLVLEFCPIMNVLWYNHDNETLHDKVHAYILNSPVLSVKLL
jgi:hypothetical protein